MRRGRVFKRCSKCGKTAKAKRCKCGHERSSWTFAVDVAASGARRRYVMKGGFLTKAAAVEAMNELQATIAGGSFVVPSKMTLAQYLERQWLPDIRSKVGPGTYDSYELHCRAYIAPRIGEIPLQQLVRADVKNLYRSLAIDGRIRNGAALAGKSIHNVHLTLRKALADAVDDHLISRNPAERAHRLPRERPEMMTWTAGELHSFLIHVEHDELAALWRLAAMTGMRRGELLGLRWRDVDLELSTLSVRQQWVKGGGTKSYRSPKTKKGNRMIALDPETIVLLRHHRAKQLEQRMLLGLRPDDDALVFCRADSSPIDPDGCSQRFERLIRESGLRRIRFHDLRHTHATLALRAGVHPKVVQERLGHSSISVTLDVYSHAIPAMQADAADRVAALLGDR